MKRTASERAAAYVEGLLRDAGADADAAAFKLDLAQFYRRKWSAPLPLPL